MNLNNSIHIGIVPDGNRRWCLKNSINVFDLIKMILSMMYKNYESLIQDNKNSGYLGMVREVSIYLLSKDNLIKRKDNTIDMIRHGLQLFINEYDMFKTLKVKFVGEKHLLPDDLQVLCEIIEQKTENGLFSITAAIGYDPVEDCRKILNNDPSRCSQSDIDLVIRSGGEKRSSGFYPLKTLYSEWVYLEKLWPDITLCDIESCIEEYSKRERRFGN